MINYQKINITSSLSGFIPSIGMQLVTFRTLKSLYYYYYDITNCSRYKTKKCPYCGLIFAARKYTKNKEQNFCSISCARRYFEKNANFKKQQLIYRIVDKDSFSKWFKTYNNRVIGYIYNNFNSELVEDLIDIWTDKAIFWYHRIPNKDIPFPFIKKTLFYYEKNLKCRKKEVFYDECSIRVQNSILGERNYE